MRASTPTPQPHDRSGFTLVEILIVVVILGILAAVVIPQFSTASVEAVRSAVERQLQTINNQVELYRAQNGQAFPTEDPDNPMGAAGTNGNWGVLISNDFLREPPRNAYTNAIDLIAGNATDAIALDNTAPTGWLFEQLENRLDIFAAGYDAASGLFHHELPGD